MKLALKIIVACFLVVVLIEWLTREEYIVYDCRDPNMYSQYPSWVVRECIKQYNRTSGVVI
jgi:hypothetical protein